MRPITFAHRGGMADAPENTLPAFLRALESGAAGLESDVQMSADGEAVLVHDAAVRSGLRRVKVAASSAERLARLGIPRLRDLYAEAGSDYELSLDVAGPEAANAAIAIARHAGAGARLWICSPDLDLLRALRPEAPDVHLVHSVRSRHIEQHERHAADLARTGVDAVNFHHTEWSLGLTTLYHRFGVLTFGWDAQEARHVRALLQMRIDAVYSDYVDRMVATVAEWTTAG